MMTNVDTTSAFACSHLRVAATNTKSSMGVDYQGLLRGFALLGWLGLVLGEDPELGPGNLESEDDGTCGYYVRLGLQPPAGGHH